MIEFTVYRILRDSEMKMESFDHYDDQLERELFQLLVNNDIRLEYVIVPDTPTNKDVRFEQRRYGGFPFLKKMQYHVRSAGVKVSFTAQLKYNM